MGGSYQDIVAMLESTHTFPCVYQFRVIGTNSPSFVASILQAVIIVIGPKQQPKIETRESAGGKHVSIHIHVHVLNASSVLKLYDTLKSMEGVKYLL
jgi:putative lipoic acid-binding regulatory protein